MRKTEKRKTSVRIPKFGVVAVFNFTDADEKMEEFIKIYEKKIGSLVAVAARLGGKYSLEINPQIEIEETKFPVPPKGHKWMKINEG